jgi:hypothetical protein
MKIISVLELRKKVGGLLDEVVDRKISIGITRGKRTLAVLVPFDLYQEHFNHVVRRARLETAFHRIAEHRAKYGAEIKQADPVELVRSSREER